MRLSVKVPKWVAPGAGTFQARCKRGVCLCVRHRHSRIAARAVVWKSSMFVRPSSFLSFFLSFYLFIRPFVLLSVINLPSSLAPFSVSLIYIFLIFFSSSHVIGLLSMCNNVHTIAYMQLLDFFYCQFIANFAPEIYDFKFQPVWRIFHGI